MRITIVLAACVAAVGTSVRAQPAFEVASIKAHMPGVDDERDGKIEVSPGSISMRGVNLLRAICWSYDVQISQIVGPDWLDRISFDIVAKAGNEAGRDQLRLMLRPLLADRFKLSLHRETRDIPSAVLTVAKGGHKLKEAAGEGPPVLRLSRGTVVAERTSMAELAAALARPLGEPPIVAVPVIDMTGLTGRYDFTLDTAPYLTVVGKFGPDNVYALRQALQDQLGLKTEWRKMPVEVLVVDHVEKNPTEN
jgi:uncharacterized protein (TIGR03435 family)